MSKKSSIKQKVVSAAVAGVMLGTGIGAAPMNVEAARQFEIRNGYTYYKSLGSTYTDKYGNKVYNGKGYLITDHGNGQKLYEQQDYYFDEDGNAVIFNYGYDNYYNGYNNYPYNYNYGYDNNAQHYEDGHINIDIDPANWNLYIANHAANCDDPYCIQRNHAPFIYGNNNNYQNYVPQYTPDYNQNNTNQYNAEINLDVRSYTLAKRAWDGSYIYAYSPVKDVSVYGLQGWSFNSIYNPVNDSQLNNVFYVEATDFGNPNIYYNNQNNNNQNYTENNQQEEGKLYTLVKYGWDGKPIYAYSGIKDVSIYGFTGWSYNSDYNFNDLDINSVFYEELNSFGNQFIYNPSLMEYIKQTSGLYIWRYLNDYGNIKYCVSATRVPNSLDFEFNSEFDPYNDISKIKTAKAVYNRGLVRSR